MLQRKSRESSNLSVIPSDGQLAESKAPAPQVEPQPSAEAGAAKAKPAGISPKRKILLGGAAAVALAAAAWFGTHYVTVGRFQVSTDDAYVRANNTTLGAKVSGYVSELAFEDNTPVRAGEVIARIDDGDYKLAVDSARDKVATQQATVERFDRQIVVPNPDVAGREKILRVHVRKVPLAPDVDLKVLARGTPGFSGADLANLVNEAALMAARKDRRMVTHRDFEDAKDKVLMGSERRSMAMNEEEKRLTAYHEAGHAIVAMNVKMADPVHKATIVPRGRALGMVMQLPEGDRYSMKYQQMIDRIAIMAGGRVAEELIFGLENITSGASSDIEQATKLARAMVTRWGFSDKLGTVAYGENQEEVFLGHSVARSQNVSEETARIIDAEVKRIVGQGWDEARRILTEKAGDHEKLSQALLEYETLSGEEIKDLLEKGVAPNQVPSSK